MPSRHGELAAQEVGISCNASPPEPSPRSRDRTYFWTVTGVVVTWVTMLNMTFAINDFGTKQFNSKRTFWIALCFIPICIAFFWRSLWYLHRPYVRSRVAPNARIAGSCLIINVWFISCSMFYGCLSNVWVLAVLWFYVMPAVLFVVTAVTCKCLGLTADLSTWRYFGW
ncbi:hypothetical protein EK21DRAFT_117876 [Setomelanomma holmii]|uniref:Uncharacterized protein n=1 Tax=Setomelanomma holmii TaxID=210430 RepID=A0A9P4GYJ3_9PLEO|nr:hypothetical protein EK21DRAFT_117876 [Setomelanomma holmii]